MWSEEPEIKSKKLLKGDRNLPLTIFSVCLEESGFESQISLLNPPENFNGKLKVPGKESKEVVITEVWGGANQGFGSCFSSRKKKVQFELKVLAMVFFAKIVLTYCEKKKFYWLWKTFKIQDWRPRICKKFVKGLNNLWQQNSNWKNYWLEEMR